MDLKEWDVSLLIGFMRPNDTVQLTVVNAVINRQNPRDFGGYIYSVTGSYLSKSQHSINIVTNGGRNYLCLLLSIFWRFRKFFSHYVSSWWWRQIQEACCWLLSHQSLDKFDSVSRCTNSNVELTSTRYFKVLGWGNPTRCNCMQIFTYC